MAKPKPIIIDGEYREVSPNAKIIDIVPNDVNSITSYDGRLIPKADFARVAPPQSFETNFSGINKGG